MLASDAADATIPDEKEGSLKLETTTYEQPASSFDTFNLLTYHERNVGRLVIDPK